MNVDINSKEFADFLNEAMELKFNKMFDAKINQSNLVKGWDAEVVSVNSNGTCNVKLATDSTTILPNIKNKSGVTLVTSDEVHLYSKSTLSDAYINIAKNK